MKYKALRPCKFAGVAYLIGDIIPDGIVHATASVRLLRDGVIEAVVGDGVTPPLATTLEPEAETPEAPIEEEESEFAETFETEEVEIDGEADELTVDKLMRLKKNELLELAEANGLDVAKLKPKSKSAVAEAVLEVIGK